MQSSSDKKNSHSSPSPAVQEAERRGAERHMFTAGAEVVSSNPERDSPPALRISDQGVVSSIPQFPFPLAQACA